MDADDCDIWDETTVPRSRVIDFDPYDQPAGRFLDGCQLPEDEAAVALEQAQAAAASSGGAVLEVTIKDGGPLVRVSAPEPLEPVGA